MACLDPAGPNTGEAAAGVHGLPCVSGAEGIVSKRKGSPYISGPTTTWRKVRCPDYVRAGEEGEGS